MTHSHDPSLPGTTHKTVVVGAGGARADVPREGLTPSLWFGLLLPPVLWSMHLLLAYSLVTYVQRHPDRHWVLHVSAIPFLVGVLIGGFISWRDYTRAGREWPASATPFPVARLRFLAAIGMLSALLFFVAIISQTLGPFFLNAFWE